MELVATVLTLDRALAPHCTQPDSDRPRPQLGTRAGVPRIIRTPRRPFRDPVAVGVAPRGKWRRPWTGRRRRRTTTTADWDDPTSLSHRQSPGRRRAVGRGRRTSWSLVRGIMRWKRNERRAMRWKPGREDDERRRRRYTYVHRSDDDVVGLDQRRIANAQKNEVAILDL